MLTRTQKTTGVVTISFVLLTYMYQRTPANHSQMSHSNELTELRQDIKDLKLKIYYLEKSLSFSPVPKTFISFLRTVLSHLSIYTSSFLFYTLFLYLFHLCILNPRTSQTMTFLHIVNIIAYLFLSIFYTSLKHFHYSNLAWLIFIFLCMHSIMSCPMFLYGFTAGSIIPLTIVYFIRPESLTNLFDFFSSSFIIAFQWSDGVAKRFNLSLDIFSLNSSTTIKMYTCYTIEYWYTIFSWLIYICLICSIILFLFNQHLKTTLNNDEFIPNENSIDCLFYYFCILIFALTFIFCRILIEHYLLGYSKILTMVFLFWFILSFGWIWLWNR